MEHNTQIYYDAIMNELDGPVAEKKKEIQISLHETWRGEEQRNYVCFNNRAYINIWFQTLYSGSTSDYIEKALKEIKKKGAKKYKNIHLIYRKKEGDTHGCPCRISLKDWRREKLAENECVYITERYDMVRPEFVYETIKKYPKFEIRTQAGFGWKGARPEKDRTLDDVARLLHWAAAVDVEVDHVQKFVLVNGFSSNDMW